MKLQFLGAARTVTGSKYLLSADQKNFLIDCGLFQGIKELRLRNWAPLPVDIKNIHGVVLTHAHLDHSGYLPLLVKNGFSGKIYCTAATKALCGVLLPDSGYLQEEDAAFASKHLFSKHHPPLPLYTMKEAKNSLKFFETVAWHQKIALASNMTATFSKAGHILGAGIVQISANGSPITFSGDLGRQKILTMGSPENIQQTDYLVVESTYGNKNHPKEDPKEVLAKIILETSKNKGVVLFPAFAVGRAQQILFLISEMKKANLIPDIPVFVNSPMAAMATKIFCDYKEEQTLTPEQTQEMVKGATFVTSVEESKNLNFQKGPAIIISASGMATGGRILHHLKYLAPDEKNSIVFAGFQAPQTRGEAMVHGAKEIKIHGEMVPVRATVYQIDTLSAHADQTEIMTWLKKFSKPPRTTFITHGELKAAEALKKRIETELKWKCVIPDYLEYYTL